LPFLASKKFYFSAEFPAGFSKTKTNALFDQILFTISRGAQQAPSPFVFFPK
jgi:hypothetical protein